MLWVAALLGACDVIQDGDQSWILPKISNYPKTAEIKFLMLVM